ncbi:ATP-binding protein [Acinetobacter baumannii]|uniref:ATP-binding protein n=1 Tax=Acinetobacter baumannii TaxID=470 RepID=UPI001E43F1EF|nr:ATP-binding protein [Acinetobacter baumannii]
MTSTTKKFKLHPKFIVNAIEQQANGLPKAIVELIMNSIDANATQINIKLWLNAKKHLQFEIIDDGKGFYQKIY